MKQIKVFLQYLAILSLTVILLYFALRSIQTSQDQSKTDFLWQTWQSSNKFYLFLMAIVAMASHVLRAIRWRMLLIPSGHRASFSGLFYSLMVGYLVNLAIPRGGELSRTLNLYKLEKIPVEISFGTVITERIVDILCLLMLLAISFWVEWGKLMDFFAGIGIKKGSVTFTVPIWAYAVLISMVLLALLVFFLRRNKRVKTFFLGFKEGLFSIFKLKNRWEFIFYSIVIWVLYFVTTYWVIKAFDQTAHLGMGAVLTIFAIGSIAMAIPLPGGTGSYHTLVPLGLVALYQLPKSDAIALVFIFHAWQTIIIIIFGIFSLIATYFIIKKKRREGA